MNWKNKEELPIERESEVCGGSKNENFKKWRGKGNEKVRLKGISEAEPVRETWLKEGNHAGETKSSGTKKKNSHEKKNQRTSRVNLTVKTVTVNVGTSGYAVGGGRPA